MIERAKIVKIFFILYFASLHVLAAFLVYDKIISNSVPGSIEKNDGETTAVVPLPSPVSIPFEANNMPPSPSSSPEIGSLPSFPANNLEGNAAPKETNVQIPENSAGKLMIPVVGIKPENLQDTYTASRSGGRIHNAIDIMAPGGTPVVAAADGEIAKFFESDLGGVTIYQLSADKKYIYYYAHLQRRADNLKEKDFVRQGTVIGYVGDTGNSGAGNYHLHFTITVPTDPKRYWDGTDINPYPFLKQGIEAKIN
ncbi:MAG TPA: M23 family metallopeptidase [Pyrinomonadaceae bacterium]